MYIRLPLDPASNTIAYFTITTNIKRNKKSHVNLTEFTNVIGQFGLVHRIIEQTHDNNEGHARGDHDKI
jgi:hypothetical protein